jgi:hypothetical protein
MKSSRAGRGRRRRRRIRIRIRIRINTPEGRIFERESRAFHNHHHHPKDNIRSNFCFRGAETRDQPNSNGQHVIAIIQSIKEGIQKD